MFIKRSTPTYQRVQVNSSVKMCKVCGNVIINSVSCNTSCDNDICSECELKELADAETDSQQHIH